MQLELLNTLNCCVEIEERQHGWNFNIYIYIYIGIMVRVFANESGDRGQIIPKS